MKNQFEEKPANESPPDTAQDIPLEKDWGPEKKNTKLSVALAAGIIIGCSGREIYQPSIPETTRPHEITKIYTSGETITADAGKIKINGWRLQFDMSELRNYAERHRVRVSFLLLNPNVSREAEIAVGSYGSMSSVFVGVDPKIYEKRWISMIPQEPYQRPIYLVQKIYTSDENTDVNPSEGTALLYPVQPKVFTHQLPDPEQHSQIFSEVPLEKAALKSIYDTKELYQRFGAFNIPIYIFDSRGDQENRNTGVYEPFERRVEMNSLPFTDPRFKDDGYAQLAHELAHAILSPLILDQPRDPRLTQKITTAYTAIVRTAGLTIPVPSYSLLGPSDAVEQSIFRVFDESHHVPASEKGTATHYGHPYSNADEFFASALTVLRYFPDSFLSEFMTLNKRDQTVVREAVIAVLDLLKERNKNQKDLSLLLPACDRVTRTLAIDDFFSKD